MRGLKRRNAAIFITSLVLFTLAGAQPAAALPVTRADVDKIFAARFNGDTPGCSIGVMEDGRPAVLQGYGMADLESRRPITPATPFDLASVSKQFTGAAIALLAVEGKLSETDDVRKYIPELKSYGRPITIGHLLHHTSGLRDYSTVRGFGPGSPESHASNVALIARQSGLNFATGTEHLYSNSNYVLLAEVVQRVTRQSFEDFVTRRLFKPLGMNHTAFRAAGLATGYLPAKGGGYERGEPRVDKLGSSGIVSTAEDMMRWFANFESGKAGGQAMLSRMLTPGKLDDGTPLTYADGIGVRADYRGVPGLTLLNHSGSLPDVGIATMMSYFPGEKFGVIYLCNASDAPVSSWTKLLEDHLGSRLTLTTATNQAPPSTVPKMSAELGEIQGFGGTYHDPVTDQVRAFTVQAGELKLQTGGREYPLQRTAASTFTLNGMADFAFSEVMGRRRVIERMGDKALTLGAVAVARAFDPAEFAGSYRSSDAEAEIKVAVSGTRIVAQTASEEIPLTPLYEDAFTSPAAGWVNVSFLREGKGKVTALTITTPAGVRKMRFDRVEAI